MRSLHFQTLVASVLVLSLSGCDTQFNMPARTMQGPGGTTGFGTTPALPVTGLTAGAAGTGGGLAAGAGMPGGTVPVATVGGGQTSGTTPGGTGSTGGGVGGDLADGGGVPDASTDGGSPGPTNVVQTCPATSTLRAGETTQSVRVGNVTRSFILHVPASYSGQSPVPLVLDWHGILMNSSLQRSFSGFAELSETEGFIVAFPEGTDTAFNVGNCCTSSTTVDDVGFARAIVAQLSQQGCIDKKRIHSTGYSMGGGMSLYLACNAADLFASIAYSAFDLQPESAQPCHPSRPIAALAFRSTGDPIVAYNGAVDTIPPNGTLTFVTFIGATANLQRWVQLNGCTGSAEQMGTCQYYRQCSGGAEVGLCTKSGGGHDYMEAAPAWTFLKRHPMP